MIRELPVTDLKQTLGQQGISLEAANIWDVRDPEDYLNGHIEGAQNYPVNQGMDEEALTSAQGTIYVLCGGGSKAPKAAEELAELDSSRDIVVLTGGTRAAKEAGMTIIKSQNDINE